MFEKVHLVWHPSKPQKVLKNLQQIYVDCLVESTKASRLWVFVLVVKEAV